MLPPVGISSDGKVIGVKVTVVADETPGLGALNGSQQMHPMIRDASFLVISLEGGLLLQL